MTMTCGKVGSRAIPWSLRKIKKPDSQYGHMYCDPQHATIVGIVSSVQPDLIATEMAAFPLKSSRNKNDSDLTIAIP